MKLQRTIFWTTFAICIISLFLFISFKTFWKDCDINEIFSNISIGVFGSSLLVFVPALITFNKSKSEAKHKIISRMATVENLVNDVHFQTTFLKDIDGKYRVDFSFEKIKYDEITDFQRYNAQKDIYIINSERVEKIYNTIKTIDNYDYSFFNDYLGDYVSLFHNENYVKGLSNCYYDILKCFMIRNFEIPYGYGARQYECGNASIGQFFDIWFKDYLNNLEPIMDKLKNLRTILLILKLEFYKKDYTDTLKSNENNKKLKLKEFIVDFHKEYKIKYSKKIEQLINKIENK